ncbi:hypothetical protein (plasmid) [Erwinia amylovora ATCC 49946]|nr:hypothetical protein EAM01S_27_00310 [Erwinia amylovora NBRC 12687 = CFBP 1232]CBJ48163.1 hypothetical protein [Erwinia amylovora ATCC 49946]
MNAINTSDNQRINFFCFGKFLEKTGCVDKHRFRWNLLSGIQCRGKEDNEITYGHVGRRGQLPFT